MNINFEDINQSKQKQEVINSSDSDIDPQRQEAPNHENEQVEGEYPSQENSIDEVPEEEMVPQGFGQRKSSSRDKFKELAQIGTELHQVVESNEVSQSADDSL